MVGGERHPAIGRRIGLRGFVVREAEVERRAADDLPAGGFDSFLAPRLPPAHLDRIGQARRLDRLDPAAEQGAEHAVDQPPRAAVDQRQSGGDDRMVGGLQPDLLRQREAKHHACLGIVGQALPGGAVDQRVEVGQPAKRLAADRHREAVVGARQPADALGGGFERPSAAQHRVEHDQRRAARGDAVTAWHRRRPSS